MSDADNEKRSLDKTPMLQAQSKSTTGKSVAADTAAPAPSGLLANYERSTAAFDEFLTDDGVPPAHYAGLMHSLDELGPAELQRRHDTCLRLVYEQGIAYNVYGDPRGMERPWQLDPIPFIIAPDEWRGLGTGVGSSAAVLDKNFPPC